MNILQTGLTGLATSFVATPLLIDTPEEGLLNAVVQLIIAIVTILGVFRKRRKP